MRRILGVLVALAASIALSTVAVAQVATSGSSSSAAALAQSGLNFAPNSSSSFNYPHQVPSQALGSFGGGANPCAEGGGFNVGTGMFGIGFNRASSNDQCQDRLTAALLGEYAKQFGDQRAAVAGMLTLCGSDPRILEKCQWAGLWVRPATPPAPPASLNSVYYGNGYAGQGASYTGAASSVGYPGPAPAPMAYAGSVPSAQPAPTSGRPAWCEAVSPGERARYARDCDP